MQDDDFITLKDQQIAFLENDKKYLQEQNNTLKNELDQLIEDLSKLRAENKNINNLLNKERQMNKINDDHIQQLKKTTEQQDDEERIEILYKQRYKQKLSELEQTIIGKCNLIRIDKERMLNDKFKEFLETLEEKWNEDKKKYFLKYNQEKKKLEDKIEELYEEIKQQGREIMNLKCQIDKKQMEGKASEIQKSFLSSTIIDQKQNIQNEHYIFQNQFEIRKQQNKIEERNNEQERLNRLNQVKDQDQLRQFKENEERRNTIKQMFKQITKSHGFIEICFLLDITGSMDPYKQQAKKCIQDSIKQIKTLTQKEARWSVIGYQDFNELKQLGGLYRQLNFTQDSNSVEQFLETLVCAGGGDSAEDIRGGMKQMVKHLKWEKEFRLAILICDAPTHGRRYNGGVGDNHPNEDIEDAIRELIEKNIFLMAIQFNQITEVMLREIKKIYQIQGKPELLLIENAQNIGISNLSNLFTNVISNATLTITQMNNTASKINNKKTFEKVEIISAMENLSKYKTDPINFDEDSSIKISETQFEIFKVELSGEFLEKHLLNIKNLTVENYFKIIKEPGVWDCKRTLNPFAKGSLKQVFLMKKTDTPTELYAIKMPLGNKTFETIEQAVKDCRSHLIAKVLLEKFIKDLEKNQQEGSPLYIPNVQYTNILILKEQNQKNSFWVAERYFSGQFVKYNNNGAYIMDDNDNQVNHLMQAFSFYTYFKSNLNYIICDVQGIGQYMTDPAINSKEGNFDETDIGDVGIKSYLGSYQGKKHLGRKYLEHLKIFDSEFN